MKISTKGRYALRMMLHLAEYRNDGYIPLRDISHRQNISKNYLEQIMLLLNKTDFLQTTRGYQGGYRLAFPPDQYTVGDILRITEGSIAPVTCAEPVAAECTRMETCLARTVWQGLEQVIANYLDNITLQDILDCSAGEESYTFVI